MIVLSRTSTERRRLVLAIPFTLLVASCAGSSAPKTTARDPGRVDLSQLWREPRDLESRDLFHGAGGRALAPNRAAAFEFVAEDDSGHSPGYDVRDQQGTEWSVKLGDEAQSELVASRVLWGMGYHQPTTYVLANWKLAGRQAGPQGIGRFRREPADQKIVSDWSWYENPFVTTRAFKGLIVVNVLLNNWDWKTSNNKVYDTVDGDGVPRRRYVVRDLGASLGKTSFPALLNWPPFRMLPHGSRNDLGDFEEQGFIKGVEGRRVEFHYRGIHGGLVDTLTVDDVLWACRLMARISDRQWRDAFRAASYQQAEQQRYIAKLKSKIREGLALAGS